MNRLKAVVSAEIVDAQMARLQQVADVQCVGWAVRPGWTFSEEEAISHFRDADILVVGVDQIPKSVLDECPQARLIACPRANPINIDLDAATERGIAVLYTPGRNANTVAEFVLGAVISLTRKIALSYHEIRNGRYLGPRQDDPFDAPSQDDIVWGFNMGGDDSPFLRYQGSELYAKTFGMIGYGAVGRRLARFLKALDMRVLIYDPYLPQGVAQADGVELTTLDSLLRQSDFVSMHCKVTPETIGMIGAREFAAMKPSCIFINTARAAVVQQVPLIDALTQGGIAGAVLDVFWQEPLPCNHPLLTMDNVVFTPHTAGSSVDVPTHHSRMLVNDILAFVHGEPMKNVFNRKALGL